VGRRPVIREFFDRPAIQVAPDLLGCVLWHGPVAVRLTEVEAYAGDADPASHAYRGRTARNSVMFGPPGHAYVYFTYGMHFCVNLVCMPSGTASAVLLRAGEIVAGEDLARTRRAARAGVRTSVARAEVPHRDLARGPARLCQALAIDRSLDGTDVLNPTATLRLEAGSGAPGGASGCAPGRSRAGSGVRSGPRVGVREGAEVPWRFWLDGEPTVSAYRPAAPRPSREKF
jgi:DNA-3-methyladenine glycosylase